MQGFEKMLTSVFGIDPAKIKAQAEEMMQSIKDTFTKHSDKINEHTDLLAGLEARLHEIENHFGLGLSEIVAPLQIEQAEPPPVEIMKEPKTDIVG